MHGKRGLAVATGVAALVATLGVAPASAINDIKGFGTRETLKDYVTLGDYGSEIGYTVRTLRPSRDAVPYPLAGRLYEADVTATAVTGTVLPQSINFLARTPDGVDYRALPTVSTLANAPLGQGGETAGKLYFDVVGADPDSVVYNANTEDLLGWVGTQPVDPGSVVPGTDSGGDATSGGGSAAEQSPGSTGPNRATPPPVNDGAQNGPYGPSGDTPPVGNN